MSLVPEGRTRFRLVAVWVIGCVVVGLPSFICIGWAESFRDDQDEYEVYSAYLSSGIQEDAHDWSVDVPIEVVIQNRTAIGSTLRFWWFYPLDRAMSFAGLQRSTRVSFSIRNAFACSIKSRFRLPGRATVFLARKNEVESGSFMREHLNSAGYIVLSGVGFNRERTQAIFYIDHFCGLCGGGRCVLMEKQQGAWKIVDEHYTWIS